MPVFEEEIRFAGPVEPAVTPVIQVSPQLSGLSAPLERTRPQTHARPTAQCPPRTSSPSTRTPKDMTGFGGLSPRSWSSESQARDRPSGHLRKALCGVVVFLSLQGFAYLALAQAPLTPMMGIEPSFMDFGSVEVGDCTERTLEIFNMSGDPRSMLRVFSLGLRPPFFSAASDSFPIQVPGDGRRVRLTARFCSER